MHSKAVSKACPAKLVYKLICFTHHLKQSPVTVQAGRLKQKEPDKVKNRKSDDWHEFTDCVTVLLYKPSGRGQVASGYSWHEQIDFIAVGPT